MRKKIWNGLRSVCWNVWDTLIDCLSSGAEIGLACLMYGWPFLLSIGGGILIAYLLGAEI